MVKIRDFSYSKTRGPTNWHGITPENEKCATGKTQSPIILDSTIAIEGADFVKMEIETTHEVKFENLGTTVEVVVEGKTKVGNDIFALKQFHFHTPSEHRINDEYFPIEIHFVHEVEEDPTKIAVVALLVQLTDWESISTLALADIISHVQAIQTPGTRTTIPTLDFTRLIHTVGTLPFYAYQGSLTTPPCSEGVAFMVAAHPIPLHVSAYNALKVVVKANARFSQNALEQQNLLEAASGTLGGLPKGEGWGRRRRGGIRARSSSSSALESSLE